MGNVPMGNVPNANDTTSSGILSDLDKNMCIINSYGKPGMFGREEFEQLAPVVDGFSLMTYDYSSAGE